MFMLGMQNNERRNYSNIRYEKLLNKLHNLNMEKVDLNTIDWRIRLLHVTFVNSKI